MRLVEAEFQTRDRDEPVHIRGSLVRFSTENNILYSRVVRGDYC